MSDESRQSLYGDTDAKSAEDIKPLGLMDILSGVFSEPVGLFKHLSKKPQWVGAMMLLVVMALLLGIAWACKVDAQTYTEEQLVRAMPQLSGAEFDRAVEMGAKFVRIGVVFQALLGTPIFLFIGGLVWWGIGMMSREDINWRPTYMHGLTVAAVPGLVTVPYYLIGALMAILKPVGTLRQDQIIPSSLGFWLQTDNPKLSMLYSLLDIFLLASYVMLFLAVRHTLRAKPWGTALCVVLSLSLPIVGILFAK
jgi:hypothetical protein